MKWKNCGWLVAGAIPIALLAGAIHGGAADAPPEPPKTKAEAAVEKPPTPTPEQKAGQILDLLGIEKPTLSEVLDYFAVLGSEQGLKPQDSPDIKAQFFLANIRAFIYENGKKVEIAKTEAHYNQSFKVRTDSSEEPK